MNEHVKKFIKKKKEEIAFQNQKEKEKILIEAGLYEKEYVEMDQYLTEGWKYDPEKGKYYREKVFDVSDAEYDEILSLLSYEKNKKQINYIEIILKVIAWIIYIGGFIIGFFYGYDGDGIIFSITFIYWCICFVSGTMFLGFSEIIRLLNEIKNHS